MLVADVVKPSRNPRWHLIRLAFLTLSIVLTVCGIAIYTWLSGLGVFSIDTTKISALQNYKYADNSIVFDRNGGKIGEFFEQYHVFTPYGDLPQHFLDALISIEDRNFYEHNGIDIPSVGRAMLHRLKNGRFTQGASTITQQLVRHLFLTREKTIERKIIEIAIALKTEKILSKEKILEIYVNTMFLGNGSYGVGAAARRYFNKNVSELSPAESALIAGLFQSPSRYNPARYQERAKKRQLQVLDAMFRNEKISLSELKKLQKDPISYKSYQFINSSIAPWFVDYIQDSLKSLPSEVITNAKRGGLRIYTTLDQALQRIAESSLKSHSSSLRDLEGRTARIKDNKTNSSRHAKIEASILVTDPRNGDILAMVGGRDYKVSKFNRATSALRSPGSVFKPIVYAEALHQGFKWSDVIFVSPVNIENYRPKNMKDDYLTETTMLRAFYRSMNSPTIEIASKLGLKSILERAISMGIRSPMKDEFGSALGSSDVTMFDLARAYSTFASGGLLTELTPITKITDSEGNIIWESPALPLRQKRVLNSQLAYLMTEGMRSVLSVGTGYRSSDLAKNAVGKTGTSNDSADNWFCGYTPDLVGIVWVGTDEHAPILANVTGGSIALPIWDQLIRSSMSIRPPRPFEKPDGITEASVHPLYGHMVKKGTKMYFLSNRLPDETESALENIEASGERGYRNVFRH